MTERELDVFIDLDGIPARAGRLWARDRGGKESASFEYDVAWRARPVSFALDPMLPLGRGVFHTELPLFNAFTDPAPDRWGQTLLRRHERARAKREARTPRTLGAVDFLALVDDETRLGALRFRDTSSGSAFLSSNATRVPPVLELARLLSATTRIVENKETDDDLALVLAPGTSLGGARPKASVRDLDGELLIAKFPRKDDEWPLTRWEATTLALAASAKIEVSPWRLKEVAKRQVLLVTRFDRRGSRRIPFMSALTALGATETEGHSYVEIAEALRRDGADVERDLRELWRRMLFNLLVSNTDDHLRNHAFLRASRGWRLSPAYDMNPMPVDVRPRVHALAMEETAGTSSVETAFAVAPSFAIAKPAEAKAIAREVGKAVSGWRKLGAKHGLKKADLDRMESAFEHDDLRAALRK
jgi:serine/threonine-protein kinase HipA